MLSINQLKFVGFLLILLLGAAGVLAQDGTLTADEVRQFEPVAFLGGTGQGFGPNEQYSFRAGLQRPGELFTLQLVNREDGSLVVDFGLTSYFDLVGDTHLLWAGNPQSQQPRLYSLSSMEEVGKFPLGVNIFPRQEGEGFLYVSGSSVYFQPLDMTQEPVMLANNLGYTQGYMGDLEELPDGHSVLIAGQNKTVLYDLEAGSVSGEIAYALVQAVTLSADGARLSALTNYDVFSSQASNWLAYDLTSGEALVELYGQRGAHGTISASGRYGAASQLVTDSRMGVLYVYDLDSGEELLRTENISHGGFPGQPSFLFVGDKLIFLRDWNGQMGFLSVFDPASGEVTGLQISVLWIVDAPISSYREPAFSVTSSMIRVYTPEGYSIFDVDNLEIVRSFPSFPSTARNSRSIITTVRNSTTGIEFAFPTDERPALPTLVGTTRSQNINVRAQPSTNGERVGGANGEVIAIGRNADSSWIFLLSNMGWVSADLVTLDGDIEALTVVP